METIFGIATNSDIHLLHNTLNELQSSTFDIAHSVSNQVTYVKKLDTATKVNANAVANLSSIVKDIVIQSYEIFQETTRDILWLNHTLNGQSELNKAIRQLEFALLIMFQKINELLEAIHSVLQGKLPITLINPSTLQNILRNVTLHLPEGYQLVSGTRIDNMPLYYQLATVTIVGNAYGIKIIIHIPLKTANQHFNLYKIIVLPFRMFGNNFVKYSVEYQYFGIDNSHRNDILITEAHRNRCTTNSITLCPADVPIYSQQVETCESSLYYQLSTINKLCRRNLFFFSTVEPLPFSDTEHCGCITFQSHARLLHAFAARTDGQLTHKRYLTQE